jgi:hypothetical protein
LRERQDEDMAQDEEPASSGDDCERDLTRMMASARKGCKTAVKIAGNCDGT